MSSAADSRLFQPLQVGKLSLKHRLVMAPLTRYRADAEHVPLPMVKTYYEQRASVPGTLLITEATFISPRTAGYKNVPGIWNDDQIRAWKGVTDAVHGKGSYIYCQLWGLGRVALPAVLQAKGFDVAGASPIPEREGKTVPRELSEEEILQYIQEYAQAASNAIAAGFDGVEIHGANGYLIDQFLQDVSNQRTDSWGNSVENRSRFAAAVAKACVDAIGADRVGIRLSPFSPFQGMRMKNPIPQFTDVVERLRDLELAYVHVVESRISGNADIEKTDKVDFAIGAWAKDGNKRPVFVAGGFKPDSAFRAADEEYKDMNVAVVFGRYFISNPDLPFRVREKLELAEYDRSTFYKAESAEGYIDYPFSSHWQQKAAL